MIKPSGQDHTAKVRNYAAEATRKCYGDVILKRQAGYLRPQGRFRNIWDTKMIHLLDRVWNARCNSFPFSAGKKTYKGVLNGKKSEENKEG